MYHLKNSNSSSYCFVTPSPHQILHDCISPFLVGFHGAFQYEGNIDIISEFMDLGGLDIILNYAGRLPEPIISKIASAAITGLTYMWRSFHLIHR
ncbi:unnamed protein product [Protopolystoma xenopodis]|uniref:Protein kinase domain-containing protein n=1 Tax=Protopolystoma xenopodis TaxID=117903 RepID=A0A448XI67_9PLAT|nr:unnamed protein product [Protopolystoma xenopodis]